ncbi:putative chitinase 3-like protein [Leptotrombidium deliense]|uniref:Putative chitinase 3-like protein n=1 Tax=Leptotrombidium deliense TaxID=299467 RepID=A0A443RZM4_9ACAR|nr:putative chitinase 3-like protein [Leptotrombidium deliense]
MSGHASNSEVSVDKERETENVEGENLRHNVDLIPKDCALKSNTTPSPESYSYSSSESTDYDEEEESEFDVVCNVCDRSFKSVRQLAQHQLHKRHFECSVCDALFVNLIDLQIHKESLEHWSDNETAAGEYSENSEDECIPCQRREEFERLL